MFDSADHTADMQRERQKGIAAAAALVRHSLRNSNIDGASVVCIFTLIHCSSVIERERELEEELEV